MVQEQPGPGPLNPPHAAGCLQNQNFVGVFNMVFSATGRNTSPRADETVVAVDLHRKLSNRRISSSVVLNESDGTITDGVKDKLKKTSALLERRSGILLVRNFH